jgi:Zn-dependent membrane protease YugP
MWFSSGYWEYYLLGIVLVPGLLLALYAQIRVKKTFNKYNKVMSMRGATGAELARQILREADIDVQVVKTSGTLTDHYSHKTKTVALSDEVYSSSSVASLGIAAHEVGHAIQYKDGYLPVKLRSILVPFTNAINTFLWPLVFIGIALGLASTTSGTIGMLFVYSGVAFFGLSVIFNLITLPTELDASRRAKRLLLDTGLIDEMELEGAIKTLNAAALTYVAALVVSILNLLRFILLVASRSRD